MTNSRGGFLSERQGARPWSLPHGTAAAFKTVASYLGRGQPPLEVAVAESAQRPSKHDIRQIWKKRYGNAAAPLLLVVLYQEEGKARAAACGPVGDDPGVPMGMDPGQMERIAVAALEEPDRHSAIRFLHVTIPEGPVELPGIRNAGMFATQELKKGLPSRSDWGKACERGRSLLSLDGRALIEGLGFKIDTLGTNTFVLRADGAARAIAVFLEEKEAPESNSDRFGGDSPVSFALASALRESLPFVVLTRGKQIRIYSAGKDVGVGRKGWSETFVEANLLILPSETAGYLPLLFGAEALLSGGTFAVTLERSQEFAADLGKRLRDRVYVDVVPSLARSIASHRPSRKPPDEKELQELYEKALIVLFRLLFIAYAEDKDLLPYRTNGLYEDHSLKGLAKELASKRQVGDQAFDAKSTDMWSNIVQLFHAVDRGNTDWSVPQYNGGLFASDSTVSPSGAEIDGLALTNAEIGPALTGLLVDIGEEGVYGPVDFRSLSVREFGTIYEGLLESRLSVAASGLTVSSDNSFVPASKGQQVEVEEGDIYLHNRSGARKASGSYFTKPFAVEHLLDHTLERALETHILRLEKAISEGREDDASDAFFDFRCADIAMGSGHFLAAAVDRIERRLSAFLSEHRLPRVIAELETLRAAALDALGPLSQGFEIEYASLLRRQVARRCVYGVDVNHIAVELARLALWIHTFVPGLPLSFLDHNLVHGDSLTGIGSIGEALDLLDPKRGFGTTSLYEDAIRAWLKVAEAHLARLARAAEATPREVDDARRTQAKAKEAVEPARQLFDLLVAGRMGEAEGLVEVSDESISKHKDLKKAELLAKELKTLHFPLTFPEVFLRETSGFDCVIGNPPWEKLQIEEHSYYSLSFPGLRGLSQSKAESELSRIRKLRPDLVLGYESETSQIQRLKEALSKGQFPGLTAGRPDLYKAFAWRFYQLTRSQGSMGVVLPRKAVEASGMKSWRLAMLERCEFQDVTMLLNNLGWVFEDVHAQYSVGLLSMKLTAGAKQVKVRGPFRSLAAYTEGMKSAALAFSVEDLLSWSESAAFPLLNSDKDLSIFVKMREQPPLNLADDGWEPRGMRELNASDDKHHFVFESARGLWPVYKGESFDFWQPFTGTVYAYADPQEIENVLQLRRKNQIRNPRSALYRLAGDWAEDENTLPARHPRIAWRDSTNRTNQRTVVAALVPPNVVLVHQAYTLFWRRGGPREEAFALGVICSIPFDWYARQFVESHVTVEFMNSAPVPRLRSDNPLRRRIEEIAGQLAAVDERYNDWAKIVGIPTASVNEDQKPDLLAELDAAVAHIYGLSEPDLVHIFGTFHVGWDYTSRLERVLKHFVALESFR